MSKYKIGYINYIYEENEPIFDKYLNIGIAVLKSFVIFVTLLKHLILIICSMF